MFIVWSQIVFHCLNFYMKMLKLEYVSSYKLSFYSGGIVLTLRLSLAPTFKALKKRAQWCHIILCTFVNIELLESSCPLNIKLKHSCGDIEMEHNKLHWYSICELTSWILTTVIRDNYRSLVAVIVPSKSPAWKASIVNLLK